MDHFESQSSPKTFSNSEQKTNSQNEKVSSLSDTNETDRRFPRPDEMGDNTDFCANDDLGNIFVASSNLAPDPSSILQQQENFTRHRHLSFPFSVLRYTSKTPSTLSSISESVGHFSEIHWKKAKLRDYNETLASSLVKQNEVKSSICIADGSNEEYRETTDFQNPEKTCMEKSDSDEECSVDDPPVFTDTPLSQLNTTNNPLNKLQSNGLRLHVQGNKGEKPFSCDICGKAFTQKGNLNRHLLVHKGEKPFVCDICGKSFRRKSNLKRHALTHTNEKPFSCEVCGKRLKSKNSLNCHLQIIHFTFPKA